LKLRGRSHLNVIVGLAYICSRVSVDKHILSAGTHALGVEVELIIYPD
jgi:hypothetical protein